MTWRPDDKRGGRRATRGDPSAAQRAKTAALIRYRVWMAERIGWPALAESFRRELAALESTR